MIRKTTVLSLLAFGLVSCTTTPQPDVVLLTSCQTYERSLAVLAGARVQGRLTGDQVNAVEATIPTAQLICGSPTPPDNATSALDSLNSQLEAIIFSAGVTR